MKTILLTLTLLITSLLSSEIQTKTADFPAKEMKKQNREITRLTALSISKDLPHTIDKYTTLTKVVNKDTTLVWTFEINTGSKSDKSVQEKDHSRMKKAVTEGICQSSSKFLAAGINTTYIYISAKTKTKLFQFDITRKDCLGI